MRERSETIYANNENEFIQKMKLVESRRDRKKKKRYEEDSVNFYTELEDSFQGYQIVLKQPSYEEKEIEDENKLYQTIENLNKNFRNGTNKNFIESIEEENFVVSKRKINENKLLKDKIKNFSSLNQTMVKNQKLESCSIKDNTNYSFNNIIFNEELNGCNGETFDESKKSTAYNTLSVENSQISDMEAFLNQNLINFDEILKFILVGDKGVGKSLFVNKFILEDFDHQASNPAFFKYTTTETLEIKKFFTNIKDMVLKIELWDTNISVLNSQIIKTYYKISHGFILIADYNKPDSLSFLEKQIENIINVSNFHNNILFILNKKRNIIQNKSNALVDEKLKIINDRFNISPIEVDLLKLDKNDISIQNFINKALIKKVGKDKGFLNKNIKENKENEKYQKTINKKCSNSNNNSPLNPNKLISPMNISHKRNHSLKRNLTEVFDKLTLISNQQ